MYTQGITRIFMSNVSTHADTTEHVRHLARTLDDGPSSVKSTALLVRFNAAMLYVGLMRDAG